MNPCANGKPLTFSKAIRDHDIHRASFNALAEDCFGLPFAEWHRAGYWGNQYQPYALLNGDRVVANASVNHIATHWQGAEKHYVQLGTVMTAPAFRGLGLSRFLMEQILADWLPNCDALYLYANDAVLGFYPRFGFIPTQEWGAVFPARPRQAAITRLDMANPAHLALLRRQYALSNPFSALPMRNNWGLLMFYCAGPLRESVYWLEDAQAAAVARPEGDALTVYDIFCEPGPALADVLGALAGLFPACWQIRLGFAPAQCPEAPLFPLQEEDSTLLVHGAKENIFAQHNTTLPLLSHA